MGRGQAGCADEARIGPDGASYRRPRRRQTTVERENLELGVLERFRKLLNPKLLSPAASAPHVNDLLRKFTVALTPQEIEQILEDGDHEILTFIPAGHNWDMDLTRFGDFPSVTFIGEGQLELAVATDTAGSGYRVGESLSVTLKQGHVYVDDTATVDLVGRSIVSCYSGSPLIRAKHEWALAQVGDRARVIVEQSFQVFLADNAAAALSETSSGQMMLQDKAQLLGAYPHTASELYKEGWKRTQQELQLAEGLTASWHEWLHRQN